MRRDKHFFPLETFSRMEFPVDQHFVLIEEVLIFYNDNILLLPSWHVGCFPPQTLNLQILPTTS